MKRLSLWIVAAVLLIGGAAQAQQMFDITNPGDPLVGVPNDNNWPAAETPPNAIDNQVAVKYLCFETSFVDLEGNVDTANGGSGFRVTPSGPRVVVKALNFASANDATERDPVAFRFSGSDESIDGPYTLIAEGTIDEFDQATAYPRLTWILTPVAIKNRKAYDHYEVFFTDIRDRAPANSMQIGEVELLSDGSLPGAAGGPVPIDGAIDVPRDVVLAWTPGEMAATHDVYFGTVFADVNDASRSNPMGVLVSQGQTAGTYDPAGLLEFGQTYYWRVDEVNSAPDFTIFKGDVWTFTAEPFAYPIENIIATTNAASDEGAGIENTVNGSGLNAADQHSTDSSHMWLGLPADGPISIQYEFDRVYKLHQLLVWNYNVEFEIILGFGLKDVTVEYSADGVDWTVLGDVQFAKATAKSTYTANTTVDFAGAPAKFVRFTVNSGWGPMGQYGLSEVRFTYVPAHAREPQPEDGATGVAADSPLSWRAGREAVSHKVYFGTDPEALDLATTTGATSYVPGALNLGTTYYWKVNEVNEADAVSVWEGNVWSFTAEEFIVVDDFESYTDDIEAGEAIFDTWLDGWVNNTGSTVGYFDAPFAEQTIVNGGKQSMPLFYDNTGVSTAEAQREMSQNWTTNGVKSLSLHFYGDPDNSGQLYVKINNTKVAYNGDAADIKRPAWQVWNIDLSTVSGSLSSVTKLTIGIEGAGASGTLYIDDIRLYPKAPEYITPVDPGNTNLVALYALDGNASDGSGRGNNGTVNGTATWVAGMIGQAMQFDGTSTYVDCGKGASLNLTDAVTVTAWIKMDFTGGDRKIASNQDGTTGGYKLGLYTNNMVEFEVRTSANAATSNRASTGGTALQQGVWYHVAGVYSKGEFMRTYVYGNLDRELLTTAVLGTSTGSFNLGRGESLTTYFWLGAIDQVEVYNRVLSQEEILWLMGQTEPVAKPF